MPRSDRQILSAYKLVLVSLLFATMAFTACPVALSAAPLYRLTELGNGIAYSVNNQGQVVVYDTSPFEGGAFLYSDGTLTDLNSLVTDPQGWEAWWPVAINDHGEIATVVDPLGPTGIPNRAAMYSNGTLEVLDEGAYGWSINNVGQMTAGRSISMGALLYSQGTIVDMGTTAGFIAAYGINDQGQIAGRLFGTRAGLWTPSSPNGLTGVTADLGRGLAYDVNNNGQVVGQGFDNGGHAFLWTPTTPNGQTGMMQDLGTLPGQPYSLARAVNDLGQVVGTAGTDAGCACIIGISPQHASNLRAFVYRNEVMYDLNDLVDESADGWVLLDARDINDRGWIVGRGNRGAFLLTPVVPEPSSLLLAAVGLGLYIARCRARALNDKSNAACQTRRRHQLSIALVLGLSATLCNSAATAHAAEIRTVALSGQQVPGAPDGTVFTGFGENFSNGNISVVLNDAGQTAFLANTSDSNFSGIWSEGSGSLNLVAAAGQQAPGLPDGVTYISFERVLINDAGATAFYGSLSRLGNFYYSGFWSSESGTSTLIVHGGEQAAGMPPGVVYGLQGFNHTLVINDAGHSAFGAFPGGSGVDFSNGPGIWAHRHGNLELVARHGSHAPGTPDGVNFINVPYQWPPALNNSGQIAFYGVDSTNSNGIWSEGTGSLALVARTGSQAPGMPDGAVFNRFLGLTFHIPALNNAGQTAFAGGVTGGGVGAANSSGIWLGMAGNLSLVVRSGDQAPGAPSGVNIAMSNSNSLALNDAGQIAFFASLTGDGVTFNVNGQGLWAGAPGDLALVARTGEHAPGTEDGVVFTGFFSTRETSFGGRTLMLNAAGQTAFYAGLTGSGVDVTNNRGIFATDRSGDLQLIAREGDLLEIAAGDFRTISSLGFLGDYYNSPTGNSDGRPSLFNNRGQLAFAASFTDGTSGIFVSNRVAVPEPSTLLLLGFGSLAVLWRRRSLVCASILAAAISISSANRADAVSIDTVPIGNPGNPGDTEVMENGTSGYGSVGYNYRIGKTEVTNAQYAEFLNAVASSDPYELFNEDMVSFTQGGIVRSGAPNGYTYAVRTAAVGQGPDGSDYTYANKPVVFVSWFDAIRFANWLHNGQGSGDTENGAYTLLGGTPIPSNAVSITRNPGAGWFLPSENEWYKAAYYDPVAGVYYDYPTGTDIQPDDVPPAADTGNSANFRYTGAYSLTDAGAFTLSASRYGTFDQGGNVAEWNEPLFDFDDRRLVRGGSWDGGAAQLNAWYQNSAHAFGEGIDLGFRIATISDLPGDFDLDGDVDGRDFLIWQRGGSPNPLSAGDLADWQANYGVGSLVAVPLDHPAAEATSPAASPVPEPGGGVLMALVISIRRRPRVY